MFTLYPEDSRPMILPFFRRELATLYEEHRDAFWVPKDIDTNEDAQHYEQRLTAEERRAVKFILAFFAQGDDVVNGLIAARLSKEVPFVESQFFYRSQAAIEDVHAQTYAKLLLDIVSDPEERDEILTGILQRPSVQALLSYMKDSVSKPLPEFLLRMVFAEGVFFQGCFCIPYWLQSRGLMPGLGQGNQQIGRDEGMHTRKHGIVYTMLNEDYKLPTDVIHAMAGDVETLTMTFLKDAIPIDQPSMNHNLLRDFVRQTIDERLGLVGQPPLFNARHSFPFMANLLLSKKTSFFERRVTEYRKTDAATSHVHLELTDEW